MAKPVFLTPDAITDLDTISSYLIEKWNVSILENFYALYEAKISVIAQNPTRYPFLNSGKKSVRLC